MDFKQRIKEGLEGKYSGLSNGLNRINKYLFGVQRGCYYLLGGLSGAAKTTFVDFMLLEAIQDAKTRGININIFYHSLEISEHSKKANWLSMLIYNKYNIIIEPEKIKGYGDNRLSTDELQIIEDVLPELDEIWDNINWIWEATNPTGIYKAAFRFMETRGEYNREDYIDEFGNKKQRLVSFTPKDPYEYNILVMDHIALAKRENNFNLKENLDKLSEYAIVLRNLFNWTIIYLQQYNQALSSIERQKFKGVDISPQQSDFKDSTNPYQDLLKNKFVLLK